MPFIFKKLHFCLHDTLEKLRFSCLLYRWWLSSSSWDTPTRNIFIQKTKKNRKITLHFWVKSIFGCLKKEKVYHHIHMNTKKNKPTENEWIFPPKKINPKSYHILTRINNRKLSFFFILKNYCPSIWNPFLLYILSDLIYK